MSTDVLLPSGRTEAFWMLPIANVGQRSHLGEASSCRLENVTNLCRSRRVRAGRKALASYFENIRNSSVPSTERYAEQLAALAHPARLEVLRFVVQAGAEGASAGDIQEHLDVPASTLSHHLKRLVGAGLLKTRLESNFHFYAAEYGAMRALTDYLWEDCCKRGESGCC